MDWMAALPVISTEGLTKLEIDGDVRVSTGHIWNSRYGSTQLIEPLTIVEIIYICKKTMFMSFFMIVLYVILGKVNNIDNN